VLQIVCTIVIELERVRSKFIGMEILNHKKAKDAELYGKSGQLALSTLEKSRS
jgi:hypothetical protein